MHILSGGFTVYIHMYAIIQCVNWIAGTLLEIHIKINTKQGSVIYVVNVYIDGRVGFHLSYNCPKDGLQHLNIADI